MLLLPLYRYMDEDCAPGRTYFHILVTQNLLSAMNTRIARIFHVIARNEITSNSHSE